MRYRYICKDCGKDKMVIQRMGEDLGSKECPFCGGTMVMDWSGRTVSMPKETAEEVDAEINWNERMTHHTVTDGQSVF